MDNPVFKLEKVVRSRSEEMQDFELLYSNIYGKAEYASLQMYLENGVREYFKKLTIQI